MGNNVIGLDVRGANEGAIPVLPPFVTQTQQSACEQVVAVPQQLFTPQPSWVQQLPEQQGMVQAPLQQRVPQLPNQSKVVLQPLVAAQPKPKKAKKCGANVFE
jgi:hypothetical protein